MQIGFIFIKKQWFISETMGFSKETNFTLPFNYVVTSLQYLYICWLLMMRSHNQRGHTNLGLQNLIKTRNKLKTLFHFPQNVSLTNLTTFRPHSQIQMALQWLPETSKKSYWCFFNRGKFETGNEMVGLFHFIIYVTILKNWILLLSQEKFSIGCSKLIRP